LTQKVMM